MLENRAVALLKIESSYGQDPSPATGDAVIIGPVKWEVIDEARQRNVVLPYPGDLASIPVGTGIKISFPMEVYGSGASTTPPKHGPLLRAAGYTQTIGGSDVSYDENATQDVDSVCMYWYEDGLLYKGLGLIVSNIKGSLTPNNEGILDFELIGLYGGQAAMVSDTSVLAPTFGTLQIPPVFRSASFLMDAYAGVISKLDFAIANKVIKRLDANSASGVKRYSLMAQDRKITGSVDPEVVALSAYNPWSTWEAGTLGSIAATLGATTGNKMVITVPNAQKSVPKLGAREGIKTYALAWEARVPLTGGLNRLQFKFN
jgi:hypothetical protein